MKHIENLFNKLSNKKKVIETKGENINSPEQLSEYLKNIIINSVKYDTNHKLAKTELNDICLSLLLDDKSNDEIVDFLVEKLDFNILNKLSNEYEIAQSVACLNCSKSDKDTIGEIAYDAYMHDEEGWSLGHICDQIVNAIKDKKYTLSQIKKMDRCDLFLNILS